MSVRITRHRRRRERGGVLLAVLLLVSVLSVLGVAVMEDIRFGIHLASNRRDQAQAQTFALGAEQLAMELLERASRARPDRTTLNEPWARGPVVFPLEGGLMQAEIADATNCFNLNSVVEGRVGEDLQAFAPAVERYRRLLAALDFTPDDQDSLSNSLVDWIDTDRSARPQGAEDYYYNGLDPAYRTANGLLADVTELRAIRGYDLETYRRVRPFVCVHPDLQPSRLNVNTLREAQAPLLAMLATAPDFTVARAREVIAQRPADGFDSEEAFWTLDGWTGALPSEEERALASLKTQYFDLKVLVVFEDAETSLGSLLRRRNTGDFVVVARHYGEAQ